MKRILSAASTLLLTVSSMTAHAHGMTPELQALFVLALVSKCKTDQPTTAVQLDAASLVWEKRNSKYVLKLREVGEAEQVKAVRQAQEAYNEGSGTFPKKFCERLSENLKTPSSELDVTDD